MSHSLRTHVLQCTRLPCPSPTPRAYSNSCPSNWWCHLTISSSVIPFASYLQSFPISGSFQMSLCFYIRWPKYWSFSFSTSPSKEYSGQISFKTDWLDFLAVQGTLKRLLQHHSSKASILWCSAFFTVQLTSIYNYWKKLWLDGLCWQSNISAFRLSSLIIAFLPRSKHLLISWL